MESSYRRGLITDEIGIAVSTSVQEPKKRSNAVISARSRRQLLKNAASTSTDVLTSSADPMDTEPADMPLEMDAPVMVVKLKLALVRTNVIEMTWIWLCFSNKGGSRRVNALVRADSVEELREKGKSALRLQGAVVDMTLEDGTVINNDSQVMFAALSEEIEVNFEIIEGQGILDREISSSKLAGLDWTKCKRLGVLVGVSTNALVNDSVDEKNIDQYTLLPLETLQVEETGFKIIEFETIGEPLEDMEVKDDSGLHGDFPKLKVLMLKEKPKSLI
eukprot:gene10062-18709_t